MNKDICFYNKLIAMVVWPSCNRGVVSYRRPLSLLQADANRNLILLRAAVFARMDENAVALTDSSLACTTNTECSSELGVDIGMKDCTFRVQPARCSGCIDASCVNPVNYYRIQGANLSSVVQPYTCDSAC